LDIAGHSRFGVDALYAPETVPAWIDDPSGYAVAVAAAARVLDALHPPQDATAAADSGYAAALAENNRVHGKLVAESILEKVANGAPSDQRTAALCEALGSLVERIELPKVRKTSAQMDFGPVWIAPLTTEQRVRLEAQHAKARPMEEPKWPDDEDSE
jgi:hypothetical protein